MNLTARGVERLAGLMPLFLLVLHLMHRRTDGCLAAKFEMAHAIANSTFEKKSLSVHGCWAFWGTIHLQHIELELDLLSIHHLLPVEVLHFRMLMSPTPLHLYTIPFTERKSEISRITHPITWHVFQ